MRYLKFLGELESSIQVDLKKPDDQAGILNETSGYARKPDIVILRSQHLDRWHSEFINPHSWYQLSLGAKPTPIVVFKNERERPCGIVHMRNLDGQRSVCISLVNQAGAWQTGVWVEIEAGDKLAISWFRDWRNTEISAINLEIINASHEEPRGSEDDLIPLGDEIDLELYAAETLLDAAAPDGDLIQPSPDGLMPAPTPVSVAEPDFAPLDPGASIIICTAGEEENRVSLDSSSWFKYQISHIPIPVVNLITDFQQLAGKIYLRKLSDWFEYSLSVVIGIDEYFTDSWMPIDPASSLTLLWSTDRSGKVLEEFHLEIDNPPEE